MGDEAPAESEAPPPAEEPPPAEASAEVAPEGEVAAPEEPAPPAESAEQPAGEEPPKEEGDVKPEEGQEAVEGGAGEEGEAPAEGEHVEAQAEGVTEEGPAEGEVVHEEAEAPTEQEAEVVEEKPKEEEPAEPVEAAEVEDDDDDFLDEDEDFRRVSEISGIGKHADDKDGKRKSMDKKKTKAMGSIISIRRGNMEYFDRQKVPKYMNSYKLESDKPFNVEVVENILKEVLIEALEDLNYDEEKVPKQAKWASSAIRAKVKEQEYDRYKIVCMVTIGEKRSQDVFYLFRMLWDVDRDKYARFTHENMYVFAVALCFGLYYE